MTAEYSLSAFVTVMVIGAGVLNALWNAIAKYVDDRLVAFAIIEVVATVAGGLALVVTGFPNSTAIAFAAVSAALHVGYDLALMNSYRLGAFNQTYPIAAGHGSADRGRRRLPHSPANTCRRSRWPASSCSPQVS